MFVKGEFPCLAPSEVDPEVICERGVNGEEWMRADAGLRWRDQRICPYDQPRQIVGDA